MRSTNLMVFIGRLGSDVRIVTNVEKPFLAFPLCQVGSKTPVWLEVTFNFYLKDGVPKVAEWMKKGTMVSVIGTPYAKLVTHDNKSNATLAMFADTINVISSSKGEDSDKMNPNKDNE